MKCAQQDFLTTLAILTRLEEEVAELRCAVESGALAEVVDELVDVAYFVSRVRDGLGIAQSVLSEHGAFKSSMREAGIRDKRTELRFASELVSGITYFEASEPTTK